MSDFEIEGSDEDEQTPQTPYGYSPKVVGGRGGSGIGKGVNKPNHTNHKYLTSTVGKASQGNSKPQKKSSALGFDDDDDEDGDVYDFEYEPEGKPNRSKAGGRIPAFSPAGATGGYKQSSFSDDSYNQGGANAANANKLRLSTVSNESSALDRAKNIMDRYANKAYGAPKSNFKEGRAKHFDEDDISLDDDEENVGEEDGRGHNQISADFEISESVASDPPPKVTSFVKKPSSTVSATTTTFSELSKSSYLPAKSVSVTTLPQGRDTKAYSAQFADESAIYSEYNESVPEESVLELEESAVPTEHEDEGNNEEEEEVGDEYSNEEFDEAEESIENFETVAKTTSGAKFEKEKVSDDDGEDRYDEEDENASYSRIVYDHRNEEDNDSELEQESVDDILKTSKSKILSFAELAEHAGWDPAQSNASDSYKMEVATTVIQPVTAISLDPSSQSVKTKIVDSTAAVQPAIDLKPQLDAQPEITVTIKSKLPSVAETSIPSITDNKDPDRRQNDTLRPLINPASLQSSRALRTQENSLHNSKSEKVIPVGIAAIRKESATVAAPPPTEVFVQQSTTASVQYNQSQANPGNIASSSTALPHQPAAPSNQLPPQLPAGVPPSYPYYQQPNVSPQYPYPPHPIAQYPNYPPPYQQYPPQYPPQSYPPPHYYPNYPYQYQHYPPPPPPPYPYPYAYPQSFHPPMPFPPLYEGIPQSTNVQSTTLGEVQNQKPIILELIQELNAAQAEANWAKAKLAETIVFLKSSGIASTEKYPSKDHTKPFSTSQVNFAVTSESQEEDRAEDSSEYSEDFETSQLNLSSSSHRKGFPSPKKTSRTVSSSWKSLPKLSDEPTFPAIDQKKIVEQQIMDILKRESQAAYRPPELSTSDPITESVAKSFLASQELLRAKLESLRLRLQVTSSNHHQDYYLQHPEGSQKIELQPTLTDIKKEFDLERKRNQERMIAFVREKYPDLDEQDLLRFINITES